MTARATESYDVIIVGYGYAGAVAAIEAADTGARVLLVEKAATPGGISVCSAGGVRCAQDADAAFTYLRRSNAGKTPDAVLRQLADGMTGVGSRLRQLAEPLNAKVEERSSPANYPFDGSETFGFCYVEDVPGFDPERDWPHVRGARQGALLFHVLERQVMARRDRIDVRLACPAQSLISEGDGVEGIVLRSGQPIIANGGVILACGGFEANQDMQAQYWAGGPALSAAYAGNTGDGIKMAQAAGADLWHMWHWHGCYGYRLPDKNYPFGVRVKRFPDWTPAGGKAPDGLPVMPWFLVDQTGRRFMNEYEPYVQDTGGRSLGHFDPALQRHDRNPCWLITDAAGLAMYPLGKPTWHDANARYAWSTNNTDEVESGVFRNAANAADLARLIGADAAVLGQTLGQWATVCAQGTDNRFGRPASSLHALEPPFFAARMEPVVSNTQGGPVHDAEQRVLDPFGAPIRNLYAAGECGSAFGHLYMSGGNLAECFIGGAIAGRNAARAVKAGGGYDRLAG